MRRMLVAISATILLTLPALAQESLLARRGGELAQIWCAACHVTGTADQPTAVAGVPSFSELASRDVFDEGALAVALFNPHPAMPRFEIGRDDIRALSAYIRSLRMTESSLVHRGRELAETRCADCHAIEGAGPSPKPPAPLFSTLGRRWPIENLAEALAEGIVVNHPEISMPEFTFDPDEVDALLAFMEAVQR